MDVVSALVRGVFLFLIGIGLLFLALGAVFLLTSQNKIDTSYSLIFVCSGSLSVLLGIAGHVFLCVAEKLNGPPKKHAR
jgi:hypothetical protein